jgi:serine/threonine protein kinase
MPLSAGDTLGPYEILAPLGAGGMGEVWKACDPRLNRLVAIKVSSPTGSTAKPAPLRWIVQRLLYKQPAERYRFLTSIAKWPYDVWMLEGWDQPTQKTWLDRWLRR